MFGKSQENYGKESNSWEESLIRPGIEGSYSFADYQKIYGRLDAVQANTFGGVDAAGTNATLGEVSNLHLEDAYLGWRSGDMFSSLGKDFLDVSFGRQKYVAGTGFLFYNEGGAGYSRGSYWIGGRSDADYAGIIRMKTGGWSTDLFFLRGDDIADSNTRAGGVTVDYTFDKLGNIGGGLYAVDTDNPDTGHPQMTIYDIRGGVKPFAKTAGLSALQPLKFEGELAHEDKANGLADGNGWYLGAS